MFGSGGSIRLGRILGIRIGASPSWFIVLFLLVYLLSGYFGDVLDTTDTTAYLVAVAAAALFFCSLLLHELGHALVARRSGIRIDGIDLWFFGGVAKLSRDSASPGEEFRIAAAGPAVTALIVVAALGIGALAFGLDDVLDSAELTASTAAPIEALLGWLATVNILLLVFNLIPAFPLDGGRIARAFVWWRTGDRNRATRTSARVGQGFGYLLIAGGVLIALTGDPGTGIYFAVLGWFLGQAARGQVIATDFSERLVGVTAADLMEDEGRTIPADRTAISARDEFFSPLAGGARWLPVTDPMGRLVGVLSDDIVENALRDGRPTLSAADLADEPLATALTVRAETPLEDLLASDALRRLGALLVVDGEDRLRGTVTADGVRRALIAVHQAPSR